MINQPTGKIVLAWRVDGVRYRVEKLTTPIMRGAGLRPFRLWRNDEPCYGGQYQYDIESAIWRANYEMHGRYSDRIRCLESRVNELTSRLSRHESHEVAA